MTYWRIQPNPDRYRSFAAVERTPSEDLDMINMFKSGSKLGAMWIPPRLKLFEFDGEEEKAVGDFPSLGGVVPLMISRRGLDVLEPLIKDDVEVLEVDPYSGEYFALNVYSRECLDQERSILQRFKSGRIKAIEEYNFMPKSLEGVHIFRLPEEVMSRTFVSDIFKRHVETYDLHGLRFFEI